MTQENKTALDLGITGKSSNAEKPAGPALEPPTDLKQDELAALRQRATLMGISFSNNIGIDSLKAKINDKLAGNKAAAAQAEIEAVEGLEVVDQWKLPLNEVTDMGVLRKRMHDENMFLIRIRVTNLNPAKKDVPGEWLTVSNKYLGTVRKFIPFGEATDDGYHVPKIILDTLKERRFLSLKPKRNKANGTSIPEQQWVKEFAIEELPYLTLDEFNQLKRQQAAAKGL